MTNITITGDGFFETVGHDGVITVRPAWTYCKDKYPEKSGRYLIYFECPTHVHNCLAYDWPYPCCKVNIAYYNGHKGWYFSSDEVTPSLKDKEVIAWMSLPERPKR